MTRPGIMREGMMRAVAVLVLVLVGGASVALNGDHLPDLIVATRASPTLNVLIFLNTSPP